MSQLKFGVSQALTRTEDDAVLRGAPGTLSSTVGMSPAPMTPAPTIDVPVIDFAMLSPGRQAAWRSHSACALARA